ncbi:putative nrps-like enzyme [Rosellinia necatrix]|uniref:Putative nrps-like enzyme n=1 Tax=Rosellinia necatrix TaxID=77044 RepID=A0A1S8ABG5_ROSNE|nr:putative nrps-like enzyme [Rosellinia necatrix]
MPDANFLRTIRSHYKLRSIILPPSIVEQILQEPDGIGLFQGIDFLITSGAPINPAVGERLSQVVEIRQPFGMTEAFLVPELDPGRNEWPYHEWNPNYKHEMQLYDPDDETYELVVLAGEANKHTTAVYHNLPGVTEFRTKDLFTRHPEKPNLYKYYGRRDDIIVLANGHKLNPLPLEFDLSGHPGVKGAIVVGNRRPHTVLLVEPKDFPGDTAAKNNFLEQLWPLVEKANTLISGQGRVQRGHVICATAEKPFVHSGKGAIVRKLSEGLYKDEIESVYSNSSPPEERAVSISLEPVLKPVYELPAVTQFVRQVISLSFAPGATIAAGDDFFGHGLDSMQTTAIVSNLRRHLQAVAQRPVAWITPRTVFYNPSLDDLSRVLATFLNGGEVPEERPGATTVEHAIEETVRRHVDALPTAPGAPPAGETTTVALIGSTGYVGVHVVAALLRAPHVSRIYCLNRAGDAQQRQEAALLHNEAGVGPLLGKLAYMTVAVGQPRLGLTEAQCSALADAVDVFVYNAWRLDFGLALRSFEPFLRATRDVVALAAQGARTSRILFVSSLSSIGRLAAGPGREGAPPLPPPEAIVDDPRAPLGFGYAQSKHVAERILAAASLRCGIPVSVVRVGQVGGSSSLGEEGEGDKGEGEGKGEGKKGARGGAWPEQRWISSLLRTAKAMGCMPARVASVDWVPVETVAAVLSSLTLRRPPSASGKGGSADAFHLYPSSPRPLPRWELVVDFMREEHGVAQTLALPEWTRQLRALAGAAAGGQDVEGMPALKVLDFYEASGDGLEDVAVATERTVAASGVEIRPASPQLVSRWLRQWDL